MIQASLQSTPALPSCVSLNPGSVAPTASSQLGIPATSFAVTARAAVTPAVLQRSWIPQGCSLTSGCSVQPGALVQWCYPSCFPGNDHHSGVSSAWGDQWGCLCYTNMALLWSCWLELPKGDFRLCIQAVSSTGKAQQEHLPCRREERQTPH